MADDAGEGTADEDDLDLCLEPWEAEGFGMVAAVQVSVTGKSLLSTLVTPPVVVTLPDIWGGTGGGWEEDEEAAVDALDLEAFLSE